MYVISWCDLSQLYEFLVYQIWKINATAPKIPLIQDTHQDAKHRDKLVPECVMSHPRTQQSSSVLLYRHMNYSTLRSDSTCTLHASVYRFPCNAFIHRHCTEKYFQTNVLNFNVIHVLCKVHRFCTISQKSITLM
jgi:hypothetical protein